MVADRRLAELFAMVTELQRQQAAADLERVEIWERVAELSRRVDDAFQNLQAS